MSDTSIRLGDVATYINGYAFKPEDRGKEGLPIIRIQDLTGNSYDLGFYDGDYSEKIEINDGDVLISWSASLGVYIWNRGKALLNQHIFKVSFDKALIDKQYFVYAVRHKLAEMESKTHGATMKHIVKKDFDATLIPYPSISEQEDIVLKLNKASSIIEARQQELQKLDDLIKARFVELFGTLNRPACDFEREILKNLCYKITDGKHGGCAQKDGTGRYFVGAREIYDDAVHYDTAPQIDVEEFEKDYKRCNVEKGDFLIVNTGATIGKSAIATDARTEHTLLQKSVALLKVKSSVLHPVFLKYCYIVNDKMYRVDSASAQPNLLLSKINTTEIYVPPMSLQEQFVAFVAQVYKSKVVVQESLDETKLLFDSLMQENFG